MTSKVESNDILTKNEVNEEDSKEGPKDDITITTICNSSVAKCDLVPISHKDFNEFIKGKGFTGRNNYSLKELKAMFGFKPLTYKNQTRVNVDDGK